MNLRASLHPGLSVPGCIAFAAVLALSFVSVRGEGHDQTPKGKVYVASVEGGAQVSTGGKVEDLALKSTFLAQDAQIETKLKGNLAIVFSNGIGVYLDPDTHIDVRRFTQEPFIPSRTDLETEPSVSHTVLFLARGTLSASTSKFVPGSTLTILTWLGSIYIHGGNVVMESDALAVKVDLLQGEATVQAGPLDPGGHVIHPGEEVIIRPGKDGQANIVQISKIPPGDLAALEARAAMAYAARKTVFFAQDGAGDVTASPVVPVSIPVQATVSPSRLP